MQDLVHYAVQSGSYDARARVAIREIALSMQLEWRCVLIILDTVIDSEVRLNIVFREIQLLEDSVATELHQQVQLSPEDLAEMEARVCSFLSIITMIISRLTSVLDVW